MWAVIDNDNVVVECITPDKPELVKEFSKSYLVVQMTEENSPAYLYGKYINDTFYRQGEEPNG